ncbi:hypothetical protein SDC9_160896 [bioreactor metagenome]|uniref:Uncharacterized protein n=1 Tax=bioreactor metagenome TaxID=1076179 RepID=A0A645FMD3_9ZZZZ
MFSVILKSISIRVSFNFIATDMSVSLTINIGVNTAMNTIIAVNGIVMRLLIRK